MKRLLDWLFCRKKTVITVDLSEMLKRWEVNEDEFWKRYVEEYLKKTKR